MGRPRTLSGGGDQPMVGGPDYRPPAVWGYRLALSGLLAARKGWACAMLPLRRSSDSSDERDTLSGRLTNGLRGSCRWVRPISSHIDNHRGSNHRPRSILAFVGLEPVPDLGSNLYPRKCHYAC